MIPCLSQVCSLNSPFEKDIEDYAAGQCTAVEVWLTKLETYLKSHTLDDVRRLLDEQQVKLPVASYQGGLLASQGEQRRLAWQLFRERLVLCQQLGIETIVVACDVPRPLDQAALERVQVSLVEAAQAAGEQQLRVALEFQSTAAIGNNLHTAAALVADVGSPHLGLCCDAYHFYTGSTKSEDWGYLTRENLFHVQLCDVADRPRELYADSDRILPGEGEIPLAPLLARLQEIGYAGHVSIELMNPQIWQISPRSFGEIALTALRRVLGQARMS
ncbi:MAG TPA: sugar phosphate isomerase/epimerase [Pirellulaceae bacterium]|nr:sugar phosphate isomerase/epimerase [Pirellulaceae bacterium]